MKRRSLLAGGTAVGVIGLSGCLSTAVDRFASLESTPAGVDPSVVDTTGYQLVGIEAIVTEEEIGAVGISDTIVFTSYLTEYEKSVGVGSITEQATALFSVLATPKVELAGRTFNPVDEMSSQVFATMIADNYDSIAALEHEADEMVTILGQSVEKSRFTADAGFAGLSVTLNIHVTEAVERGEDLLVAIGVYPRLLQSQEASTVRELTEAISDEPVASAVVDDDEDQTNIDQTNINDADDDDDADDTRESTDDDNGELLGSLD